MPKLKTHKGAAARFHLTGSGKLVRLKSMSSHLRSKKTKRTKRQFGGKFVVNESFGSRLKSLLPYGTGKH